MVLTPSRSEGNYESSPLEPARHAISRNGSPLVDLLAFLKDSRRRRTEYRVRETRIAKTGRRPKAEQRFCRAAIDCCGIDALVTASTKDSDEQLPFHRVPACHSR